ncbi:MAG: lysophospholipid acyltransferase family protein [Anaerolineales bacterium]
MTTQLAQFETESLHQRRYYLHTTRFWRILYPPVHFVFTRALSRLHIEGSENIPASGGVILACNHVNDFDVFVMQMGVPRQIFFMAKAELHRNPLIDTIIRPLGAFPVQRGMQDDWAMQHAQRILEHDLILGMFPEGTRNWGCGLKPAKTGAARLAMLTRSPIVPVAVVGIERMLHRFPRPTPVELRFAPPIYPQPLQTAENLTEQVMRSMAAMLPPEQRGVYA